MSKFNIRPLLQFVVTLIILWLLSLALPKGSPPTTGLAIRVMDVGQGDAFLIQSPSGFKVLVDGGSGDRVLSELPKFMSAGDRTIDMAVLTHPHEDHEGGLIQVLKTYDINSIVVSTYDNKSAEFTALRDICAHRGVTMTLADAGDNYSLGEGVSLIVNWPPADSQGSFVLGSSFQNNLNLSSLVFTLDYNDFEMLFLGDAESSVQESILKSSSVSDVEILKVAHHGSKNGLNRSFLRRVAPELAVVSVGENSYGLPNAGVMEYLKLHVARVLRTDESGDITISSDGKSWSVVTSR